MTARAMATIAQPWQTSTWSGQNPEGNCVQVAVITLEDGAQ